MIYPTRRAIYLLLLGAPLALALGLLRPDLWVVAPAWIGLLFFGLLLDAVLGANPRRLALDAQVPHQVGVGDPFDLRLSTSGGGVPRRAEIALQLDDRLAPGGRLADEMVKGGDANAVG